MTIIVRLYIVNGMVDRMNDTILKLLCDVMNTLDEDFVPGPKLADLENRFHALTGLHRGDEL